MDLQGYKWGSRHHVTAGLNETNVICPRRKPASLHPQFIQTDVNMSCFHQVCISTHQRFSTDWPALCPEPPTYAFDLTALSKGRMCRKQAPNARTITGSCVFPRGATSHRNTSDSHLSLGILTQTPTLRHRTGVFCRPTLQRDYCGSCAHATHTHTHEHAHITLDITGLPTNTTEHLCTRCLRSRAAFLTRTARSQNPPTHKPHYKSNWRLLLDTEGSKHLRVAIIKQRTLKRQISELPHQL